MLFQSVECGPRLKNFSWMIRLIHAEYLYMVTHTLIEILDWGLHSLTSFVSHVNFILDETTFYYVD